MPKFAIPVKRIAEFHAVIEVEADDLEQAQNAAMDIVCGPEDEEELKNWKEFDWNNRETSNWVGDHCEPGTPEDTETWFNHFETEGLRALTTPQIKPKPIR